MKQLALFVLILAVVLACKKSNQEKVPSDPLFQKWKLTERKPANGTWETVSDGSLIEFRTDGSIRYQSPEPACCAPIRFERSQQTLKLTDYYGGGGCIYVDCAPPTEYKIVSVTADELIIESVFGPNYPGTVSPYTQKYIPAN